MAKILSKERVLEYSKEFKVKIVELTNKLDVKAIDIAEIFNLHPVMVYRWRQEHKEGKLKASPTRKVQMTLKKKTKKKPSKRLLTEKELLKKEIAELKKENDFLKKWQQYLTETKKNDSDS
mgnify:CR=1 FL=1|jgi:transposase